MRKLTPLFLALFLLASCGQKQTPPASAPAAETDRAALPTQVAALPTQVAAPTSVPTPEPSPSLAPVLTPGPASPSEPAPIPAPSPAPTPVPTSVPTPAPTPAPTATAHGDKQEAMSCIGQDASALLAAVGEPISRSYAPSCLGDGDDGEWSYDGFTVYTYRENGVETVQDVE